MFEKRYIFIYFGPKWHKMAGSKKRFKRKYCALDVLQANSGYRWLRFPGFASVRKTHQWRPRSHLSGQLLQWHQKQRRSSDEQFAFRIAKTRYYATALCRGGRDLQLGLPGLACSLPAWSDTDDQNVCAGFSPPAWPCKKNRGENPSGFHQWSLWWSSCSSPTGKLLGQRESYRYPCLLRRRKALCWNAFFRLSSAAWPRYHYALGGMQCPSA